MEVLKKFQKISKRIPRMVRDQATSKSGRFVYKFGTFCLDRAERILLDGGENVSLTPKVFDTLVVLVQNAGRLVTKESLLAEVWPDTFVEEANLSVNIATLRKALGEIAGEHQYIQTISKRGYRFVAKVVEVESESRTVAMPEPRPALIANKEGTTDLHQGLNSLAVLPFDNGTADPNAEYLSDGLTESIINNISQLQNLRVVARNTVFRYKAKEADPQNVGRELGVRSVLSGRILQLGDRLIIRAELIDVSNGWQIWGDQYHRKLSDILAVQEEISEAISAKLKVQLTREEKDLLGKRYTENVEAYRFYLKGRYHWNKFHPSSLRKAIEYFEQAIEIDPTYALAYAGLADSYYRVSNVYAPTREAMPKAKAAAMKALEIDETVSEAHAALGLIRMFYDWDWSGAKEEFERAIEISPNNAMAHQRFGLYFNLFGRFEEAMRELELAFAIDPLSPQVYWSFALSFFLGRRDEQAIEQIQKTLDLDGNYQPALYLLGRVYIELGELAKAIAAFKNVLALNDAPLFLAALGHAYARAGKHQDARKVLNVLQEQSNDRYVSAYSLALVHLALGDKNQAFSSLEQAFENRCEMMTWLKVDPAFDSIRADLRFANLLRRVGLDREYQVIKKFAAS
jgi:TolB-like protein/Tfp pilus assembly protein PilF